MTSKPPALLGIRPLVALATLVLVCGATDAWGQRGERGGDRGGFRGRAMGGFGRMMQPEFVRRDMTLISRELDLDEDQQTIIEALLGDYQDSFQSGVEEMRAEFSGLRPQTPEDIERREQRRVLMAEFRKIREEFRAERERAGDDQELNEALQAKIRVRLEPIRNQMTELRPERSAEATAQWREQMA